MTNITRTNTTSNTTSNTTTNALDDDPNPAETERRLALIKDISCDDSSIIDDMELIIIHYFQRNDDCTYTGNFKFVIDNVAFSYQIHNNGNDKYRLIILFEAETGIISDPVYFSPPMDLFELLVKMFTFRDKFKFNKFLNVFTENKDYSRVDEAGNLLIEYMFVNSGKYPECPVCMEETTREEKCHHVLCFYCSTRVTRCPICRAKTFFADPDEDDDDM